MLYNIDQCGFSDTRQNRADFIAQEKSAQDWYSFPACRSSDPGKGSGSCPTSGCGTCPTSQQWGDVSTYKYPGITHGSYTSHKDSSKVSTSLGKNSGKMPIETCCQSCSSNPNCLSFSWKNDKSSNSGECSLFTSNQCTIVSATSNGGDAKAKSDSSGEGDGTDGSKFFSYGDDGSYSMQICGRGTPTSFSPGVKGDPHFAGWDGVHFDFTGRPGKSYCLLSDDRVHINMFLQGFVDKVNGSDETHTWIKGMGILSKGHKLSLAARESGDPSRGTGFMKKMVADGKEFSLAEGESFETNDGSLRITYQGHRMDADDEIDVYEVSVEGAIKFLLKMRPEVPSLRIPQDSWIHFSMEVLEEKLTAEPHGILGQTLFNLNNPDSAPEGYATQYSGVLWAWQVVGSDGSDYIQGKPRDYMTSNVLTPDCRFSRLEGVPEGKLGVFPMGCSRKSLVC